MPIDWDPDWGEIPPSIKHEMIEEAREARRERERRRYEEMSRPTGGSDLIFLPLGLMIGLMMFAGGLFFPFLGFVLLYAILIEPLGLLLSTVLVAVAGLLFDLVAVSTALKGNLFWLVDTRSRGFSGFFAKLYAFLVLFIPWATIGFILFSGGKPF